MSIDELQTYIFVCRVALFSLDIFFLFSSRIFFCLMLQPTHRVPCPSFQIYEVSLLLVFHTFCLPDQFLNQKCKQDGIKQFYEDICNKITIKARRLHSNICISSIMHTLILIKWLTSKHLVKTYTLMQYNTLKGFTFLKSG